MDILSRWPSSWFCFREFSQALVRLTKMIRGMGDPLVAVYARTYICRVGINYIDIIILVGIYGQCKPYTAHKVQGKPYFCNICPCANGIVYARLEDVRTFLCLFWTILKFLCTKNFGLMDQSPSFFPTEDWVTSRFGRSLFRLQTFCLISKSFCPIKSWFAWSKS